MSLQDHHEYPAHFLLALIWHSRERWHFQITLEIISVTTGKKNQSKTTGIISLWQIPGTNTVQFSTAMCSAHCTRALLLWNHFHWSPDHVFVCSHITAIFKQPKCLHTQAKIYAPCVCAPTDSETFAACHLLFMHASSMRDMTVQGGRCLQFGHIVVQFGLHKREKTVQQSGMQGGLQASGEIAVLIQLLSLF